eukprot:scaffold72866_cov62-Attheya_sp.AAC.1
MGSQSCRGSQSSIRARTTTGARSPRLCDGHVERGGCAQKALLSRVYSTVGKKGLALVLRPHGRCPSEKLSTAPRTTQPK